MAARNAARERSRSLHQRGTVLIGEGAAARSGATATSATTSAAFIM